MKGQWIAQDCVGPGGLKKKSRIEFMVQSICLTIYK